MSEWGALNSVPTPSCARAPRKKNVVCSAGTWDLAYCCKSFPTGHPPFLFFLNAWLDAHLPHPRKAPPGYKIKSWHTESSIMACKLPFLISSTSPHKPWGSSCYYWPIPEGNPPYLKMKWKLHVKRLEQCLTYHKCSVWATLLPVV